MADEPTEDFPAWVPHDDAYRGAAAGATSGANEPERDPLDEARSLLVEHERQQDEACRAELEAVLAKYGRKLVVTQPQITIVPM
ncbi:hypothetical protein [Streptomyces sp. NPDC006355]|uniref:hypothetical protein n=1 Tax=Streptomyces sp. NPDC006355 TaxID=3156758 RepID=UPI0033B414E5